MKRKTKHKRTPHTEPKPTMHPGLPMLLRRAAERTARRRARMAWLRTALTRDGAVMPAIVVIVVLLLWVTR